MKIKYNVPIVAAEAVRWSGQERRNNVVVSRRQREGLEVLLAQRSKVSPQVQKLRGKKHVTV